MLVYGAGAFGAAFFLPEAGANPIWADPELAPGPWTSGAGATQNSGGSATPVVAVPVPVPGRWQERALFVEEMTAFVRLV